jgi:L-malate glycosyltransferase
VRRVVRLAARLLIEAILAAHSLATGLGRWLRRRPRPVPEGGLDVLLTGTFHSENWIGAHLGPLAQSRHCARVWLVTTTAAPPLEKVVVVRPPAWLVRIAGGVPARLATFLWLAVRRRPDLVGGFHLLLNGLVAAMVSSVAGCRSLYFCVGGPEEFREGGLHGENRLFALLEVPHPTIERRLIEATRRFDLVVTMGQGAARFFRERSPQGRVEVVPGGIDEKRFHPGRSLRDLDLILVGRLVPIKRIDIFLDAVARVSERRPQTKAAVIGDGPLRAALEEQVRRLGLVDRVVFMGQRADVEEHLRRARVFCLTSDSEGLALSVMEAMSCATPAVVSRVGDLPDLVEEGVNGYLVESRLPEAFARRFLDLLEDPALWQAASQAALQTAARYSTAATVDRWNDILATMAEKQGRSAR